jgi:hypothetical protein
MVLALDRDRTCRDPILLADDASFAAERCMTEKAPTPPMSTANGERASSSRRRTAFLLSGLLALVALVAIPARAQADGAKAADAKAAPDNGASATAGVSPLDGTWRLVAQPEREKARLRAIEGVTGDVMFLIRGVARSRLDKQTVAPSELTIADKGSAVTLSSKEGALTLPIGGKPQKVSRGETTGMVQLTRRDGRLILSGKGENGTRVTTFALSSDGRTLTRTVTIQSDVLSGPLVVASTYRRRAGG